MEELKRQVKLDDIVIAPLALAADQQALCTAIPEATRNLITSHTRAQTAKILERGLTNPLEIKKAAANIEMLDNK